MSETHGNVFKPHIQRLVPESSGVNATAISTQKYAEDP